MSGHATMDEREPQTRVPGRADAGIHPTGEIARFLDDLDAACPEPATGHLEAAHLSSMVAAAHLLAENGDPVARPASNAHGPARQASGLPKLRRTLMNKLASMTTGVKVAIGASVLVFAFTGVAVAGVLPHAMQHAMSGAAATVGVSIPDPDAVPASAEETATEPSDAIAAPSSDESSATAAEPSDNETESAQPAGGQSDEQAGDQNDQGQNDNADEQDGSDGAVVNPGASSSDQSDASDAHPGVSVSAHHGDQGDDNQTAGGQGDSQGAGQGDNSGD